MHEIGSFILASYSYLFVYGLAAYPTVILVELVDDEDKPAVRLLKTAAIVLLPAAFSWLMNDFVFGSNSLEVSHRRPGIGPFEW